MTTANAVDWWVRWKRHVVEWMLDAFKEVPSFQANAAKLSGEAKEAAAAEYGSQHQLEEIADCRICLMALEASAPWTEVEIREAVFLKMKRNKRRNWRQLEDGTWQHVKENDDK